MHKNLPYRHFLIPFLLLLFAPTSSFAATMPEKVSLQLEWKYQFEHAGFIMAREKGFYQQAGLDVALLEYSPEIDTVSSVLSQSSNYGIHNASIIISNGKLLPTVLMATYYQQSPLVFVTRKGIKKPADLIGKTIMGTRSELEHSSLALMLNHFAINRQNSVFKDHTFDIADFVSHKVDAMSAFRTNQLYELDRRKIPYHIIDPLDYGFVMSAVNLFTSYEEATKHPQRTRRFIDASNRGWAYALAHPEETIAVIYNRYSKQKSIAALRFEAAVAKKMMLLDFFKIGATNRELSLRAFNQLQYSGLLQQGEKLGRFLFDEVVLPMDPDLHLSASERLYLEGKKEITMCADPDWMPLEGTENGKHTGIVADIFARITPKLPVPIRLLPTGSWQESLSKIEDRQCDILSMAQKTPERLKYMDFTSAYMEVPVVMATATDTLFVSDLQEVKDKKIGIVKGYAYAELLSNRGLTIVEVDSITDGLKRVESGELFGYIDNLLVIARHIQQGFSGSLKISSRLEDNIKLSIASRNDEPQLHTILEQLTAHIRKADIQAAFNKWVAVQRETTVDYDLLWKLLLSIVIVAAAFLYYYKKLHRLNAELRKLSTTDKLTGLYNRLKIDALLMQEKANVDRYPITASILLIDIDFFKEVNDRFGHLAGDEILVETARFLTRNIRETDYVGRWGGDEFLIICPNTDIGGAGSLADKLVRDIHDITCSFPHKLSLSIGIQQLSATMEVERTLFLADRALYQAKQRGRNQACYGEAVQA